MKDQFTPTPESERLRFQADRHINGLKESVAEFGLTPFEVDHIVKRKIEAVHERLTDKNKAQGMPNLIRNLDEPGIKTAWAIYREIVKPLLSDGKEVHKPTDEEVLDFCQRLNGEGVKIAQYYAAHKTKSPNRTGSPDTLVDLAEVEMLKNYTVMSLVANHFGMSLKFIIVDESDAVPSDNILGFTQEQKDLNAVIIDRMLEELGATDKVLIRPLVQSISTPLRKERFDEIYEVEIEQSMTKVINELHSNESDALTIRIFTFLDCTPDEGFINLGLSQTDIDCVRAVVKTRNIEELLLLPEQLLSHYIRLTAHFETIMGMRSLAAQVVRENGEQDKFPQYGEDIIYGGVTRSAHRWSFLTHPVRNKGRTINPTHGLAVYNGENFAGNAYFIELFDNDKFKLIYFGEKPICAIQNHE